MSWLQKSWEGSVDEPVPYVQRMCATTASEPYALKSEGKVKHRFRALFCHIAIAVTCLEAKHRVVVISFPLNACYHLLYSGFNATYSKLWTGEQLTADDVQRDLDVTFAVSLAIGIRAAKQEPRVCVHSLSTSGSHRSAIIRNRVRMV